MDLRVWIMALHGDMMKVVQIAEAKGQTSTSGRLERVQQRRRTSRKWRGGYSGCGHIQHTHTSAVPSEKTLFVVFVVGSGRALLLVTLDGS